MAAVLAAMVAGCARDAALVSHGYTYRYLYQPPSALGGGVWVRARYAANSGYHILERSDKPIRPSGPDEEVLFVGDNGHVQPYWWYAKTLRDYGKRDFPAYIFICDRDYLSKYRNVYSPCNSRLAKSHPMSWLVIYRCDKPECTSQSDRFGQAQFKRIDDAEVDRILAAVGHSE